MQTHFASHGRAQVRGFGVVLACVIVFLFTNNPVYWRNGVASAYDALLMDTARYTSRVVTLFPTLDSSERKPAVNAAALEHLRARWDSLWSTDVSAAERNVATLENAVELIERANRGDLDATIDLVGAATWCTAGGPLVNVNDAVGDTRRPCYERFGHALASRDSLERAAFVWLVQLSTAGLDDATLYASALLRGQGADLTGGLDQDDDVRAQQHAQLLGHLQTLASRGSADAASELHGHWSGDSTLNLRDDALGEHYARLAERIDPARTLAARD
jgi:hypothetical protein